MRNAKIGARYAWRWPRNKNDMEKNYANWPTNCVGRNGQKCQEMDQKCLKITW